MKQNLFLIGGDYNSLVEAVENKFSNQLISFVYIVCFLHFFFCVLKQNFSGCFVNLFCLYFLSNSNLNKKKQKLNNKTIQVSEFLNSEQNVASKLEGEIIQEVEVNFAEEILEIVSEKELENFRKCTNLILNLKTNQKNSKENIINSKIFTGIQWLTKLTINNCSMTYFHINENKLPYLEELDLSNNKLNKFQISNLHSLKIVDISSNQIHVLDQHNLNHFRNLKNLISVDLSSNCLHQICSLETLFKDNQNLENLNLENNFLSLIEIFSVIKSVKRLNLSNNFLRSIPKNTFKNLVCLKELDLSFNGWTNYDWIDELSGSLENISIQNFSSLDVVVDQFKHFPLEKLSINEKLNQKAKKVYQIDTYLKENIDIFTILLKKGLTNDWMNNFNNESDISKLNQEINDLKYILSKEKSKNIFESHIRNEILMKFFFFLENNDMKENIAWNIWRTGISVENILEEVKNEFLGLDNVIEQLNIIGNSCLLKLSKGEKIEKDNFIFIGQPGTGKTTLARKLSKLFYAFGLITSPDKFIEKGNNLKGSVVGKAQENLIKSFEEAKGGILFIDEAYSLLSSDYGKEVIDTLVQQMTLDTTDAIVIIAGYEKEMDEFLNYNSGLSRRFQTVIDFGYYDEKALMNIFNNLKGNLTLDSSAMKILQDFFQKNKGNPTFGNAGGVIKLIKNINKMLSKEVTILTSNENEIVSGNILRSAIASLNKMIDEKIVKILRTCKMEGYGHRFRGFNLHTFSQLTEKDLRNDFNISNVSDRKTILQYAQYFSYCKHPATTSIVLDLIEFQFISIYDAIEIIFQFLHFDSSFFQNVISFLLKNYENLDDLLKLTKKELESSYDALYKEIDDFLNSVEIKKKMNEELEKSFDGIPSLNHWSKDENLKLLVNIRKEIKNHKIKMITQEFKNQFRTLIDYFQKKKNFKNLVPFFEEIQAELKELTKLGLKNDVHNYHYIPQIQKKLQNEEDSNMQCEKLLKLISEATLYSKNHSHQNQVKLIHIDNHNSLNEKIEDLKVNKTDFENAKKGKIRSIMIILDITNLLENEIFHVSKTSLSVPNLFFIYKKKDTAVFYFNVECFKILNENPKLNFKQIKDKSRKMIEKILKTNHWNQDKIKKMAKIYCQVH